jgi:hypothetical protein
MVSLPVREPETKHTGLTGVNVIGALDVLLSRLGAEKRADLIRPHGGAIPCTTRHNAGSRTEELKVLELIHHKRTKAVVHRVNLYIPCIMLARFPRIQHAFPCWRRRDTHMVDPE